MKTWEYETIRDASTGTIAGQLCDWPEVAEALTANGISLHPGVRMKAVKEICRLVLTEQEAMHASNQGNSEPVANEWVRGDREYPGDSHILAAMNEYMSDHITQRHYGTDVLASARLDDAERLIAKLRDYFSL
jgi:hypothetical protein